MVGLVSQVSGVLREEVGGGSSKRPDGRRVYHSLAEIVMFDNVGKVESLGNAWDAVDIAKVPVEVWHLPESIPVGFEVAEIHAVIAGKCNPQADVTGGVEGGVGRWPWGDEGVGVGKWRG